jgi:hypothetical protein
MPPRQREESGTPLERGSNPVSRRKDDEMWGSPETRAGMRHAARHGLSDTLIVPRGSRRHVGDVLCQLLRYVAPALEAADGTREVTGLIHRLLQGGTGADRQ